MLRLALIAAFSLMTKQAVAEEVSVFAAASMKTALDELAADFEAKTGHEVTLTYAGSNLLARQIIGGAPADIFISANTEWMDEVEKAGMLVQGSPQKLIENRLVLIAHDDAPAVEITPELDLKTMLNGGKLAMALVDSVPAGQYGKAALQNFGLWEGVAPSVAQADNVRAALALVSTGEAPYGIVYESDAHADPTVHVIATFPMNSHPRIIYPMALLSHAQDEADREFFYFLLGSSADSTFLEQGFTPQIRPR
ncbi:MAG: molybdate ABC transporter substrate-binding protein [Paracoccus sp. (in: a-proteobacteria)]